MAEDLLTFKEVMQNPTGKNTGNVSARYAIIDNMTSRASKLMQNREPKFNVYKEEGNFIVHFKLASEQDDFIDLFYDVVLRFIPDQDTTSRSISNYKVQFFSNSPAFVFTYAYIVKNRGWFIEELKDKFNDVVFEKAPKERNPEEVFGFEKSLWFCMWYLRHKNLTLLSFLEKLAEKDVSWKKIRNEITHTDNKLDQYNKAKRKAQKVYAENKVKEKKKKQALERKELAKIKQATSGVKATKSVKKVNGVKRVKKI